MEILIDLALLDENEENPFNKIMSLIEKAKLQGSDNSNLDSIEEKILLLERQLQDLDEKSSPLHIKISKEIISIMNAATHLMVDDTTDDTVKLMGSSFDIINSILYSSEDKKEYQVKKEIELISPVKILHKEQKSKVYHIELLNAFQKSISKSSILGLPMGDIKENPEKEIWDIDFHFETPTFENHLPLEFLYTFIEVLNKYEGVTVFIDEIKIGSLKAKLKVVFDNLKGKEKVKELFDSSRKFTQGKLEKDYEESLLKKTEREKIEVEKEIAQEELKNIKSTEVSYLRSLEIEEKEQDVLKKRLENEKLEMELFMKKKEILAELLSEGFISQHDFKMVIKGIPFLKMQNGRLFVGEDIETIDSSDQIEGRQEEN